MRDVLTHYLERHAEPDHQLARELDGYEHVVAVPAFDEGATVAPLLDSFPRDRGALLVLVVNADEGADASAHAANQETLRLARERGESRALAGSSAGATLVRGAGFDLLTLERSVPKRQGVGLARKIGGDVAAGLASLGKLASGWLRMTDADAVLPPDYLDAAPDPAAVAQLHPFEHVEVAGYEDRIRAYEAHLHRYVAGLAEAGSPYAFHSIGSTISVDIEAYAKVRGVPRRPAAEDFYLLDKLAKLGPVEQRTGAPIRLSGRPSHRVPFGTGVSVQKDLRELERTYDPRSYLVLGAWLRAMEQPGDPREVLEARLPASLHEHRSEIVALLSSLGAFDAVERGRGQTKSEAALRRSLHTYFDGFRAMKLVRGLRAQLPDVSLIESLGAKDLGDALRRSRREDHARRAARPLVGQLS